MEYKCSSPLPVILQNLPIPSRTVSRDWSRRWLQHKPAIQALPGMLRLRNGLRRRHCPQCYPGCFQIQPGPRPGPSCRAPGLRKRLRPKKSSGQERPRTVRCLDKMKAHAGAVAGVHPGSPYSLRHGLPGMPYQIPAGKRLKMDRS
jgi:hypothetical protein